MSYPLEIRRAYARGYNSGSRGKWPEHRPPVPPDELTGKLTIALQRLRDAVDGQLAMFDPEDEMAVILGPYVDDADQALMALGAYCLRGEPEEEF